MTILSDKPSLLSAMMADQSRQTNPVYQPSIYWLPYQKRVARYIAKHGITRFRADPMIGKGFADCLEPLPFTWDGQWKSKVQGALACLPLVSKLLAQREREIVRARQFGSYMQSRLFLDYMGEDYNRLWPKMPETTLGGSQAVYTPPAGPEIATLYLRMASRIVEYMRHRSLHLESTRSFLEIGGGFGAMTHLLLHTFPAIRKVIYIDIPPMLYLATQYLRAFYPRHVHDYEALRSRNAISFQDNDDLEIFCLPPWMFEVVQGQISLFHNAASFSEMNESIVRNYATQIRRLAAPDTQYWLILNKIDHPVTDAICTPQQIRRSFDWLHFIDSVNFEENMLWVA